MTRISDLLSAGRTYSFEFFPPKSDQELVVLSRTLAELQPLGPSFVSVTYRGGAESRQRTQNLVTGMLHTSTLVPMAHLVCVAHSRLELAEILVSLRRAGVENVLALGGDPSGDPEAPPRELEPTRSSSSSWRTRSAGSPSAWPPTRRATRPRPTWTATGTAWPRSCGSADFAITQFFFEADEYLGLVADLAERGVDKPVLPGIMPVTSLSSIPRMATMGAAVPAWMVRAAGSGSRRGRGPTACRRCGVEARDRAVPQGARGGRARACTSTRSTARARPATSISPSGSRPR